MNIYNLGTDEYCCVDDSIGWICDHLGLSPKREYTGGERGWIGDSPFIFLDCSKVLAPEPDKSKATPYKVSTTEDLRWKRCNIKSTALLGNVMHYQHGHAQGNSETILYNPDKELTEAAACNVYVIKNGVISTPELDYQILPGITRLMLIDILRKDGAITIEERTVTLDELLGADEVWITSSSKELAPVVEIDGTPVGDGQVGDV